MRIEVKVQEEGEAKHSFIAVHLSRLFSPMDNGDGQMK